MFLSLAYAFYLATFVHLKATSKLDNCVGSPLDIPVSMVRGPHQIMQSGGRNLWRLNLDKYLECTDQRHCLLTIGLVPSWPCTEQQLYHFMLLN